LAAWAREKSRGAPPLGVHRAEETPGPLGSEGAPWGEKAFAAVSSPQRNYLKRPLASTGCTCPCVRKGFGLLPLRNTDPNNFPVAPLTGHAEAFNHLSEQPIRELKIGSSPGSPTTLAAMVPKAPGGALCTLCEVMRLRVVQLHFSKRIRARLYVTSRFGTTCAHIPKRPWHMRKTNAAHGTSTPIIPTRHAAVLFRRQLRG
jgi:hypothetical protein